MKSRFNSLLTKLTLTLAFGLVCAATARAQVVVTTNIISGTIQFTNSNPDILSLLNPPGGEGMSNLSVTAHSVPPATFVQSSTGTLLPDSPVSASYSIIVDAQTPPVAFSVQPYISMQGQLETFYFNPQTSDPVAAGVPPLTVNFAQSLGVVTVRFVDSTGASVAVDGGRIEALGPDNSDTAVVDPMPAGTTAQRIYLAGGENQTLNITVHRGTNFYTDRIDAYLSTNLLVAADAFTDLTMVLPDAGALGAITGNFDILGEFELSVPPYSLYDYAGYSSVVATYGPFANKRYAGFAGSNFDVPSSGAFTLSNVVSSTLDPLSVGYEVYAQAAIRTNRAIEFFSSPALGSGANPPVTVAPGETKDLGNLFVIHPGNLRGRILLQTPSELPGEASPLRGIYHSGDDTTNGIPNSFAADGVYWSAVEAEGLDAKAPGATYTASGGVAVTDFDGAYDGVSGAYSGTYEMALGGLNGESTFWNRDYFSLTMTSYAVSNSPTYFDEIIQMHDLRALPTQIDPGQPSTNDIAYCFSDVTVVFNDPTGTFYNPFLNTQSASGTFAGTNFQGNPANYSVYLSYAYGLPSSVADATNSGYVNMILPEGSYVLNPSVTPGDSTSSFAVAGLDPINLTVGCGQRVQLEPCLQVVLNAPECAISNRFNISGSVPSCGNPVASISYSVNGGPEQTICTSCGSDPSFSATIDLGAPADCSDNTLKVTATDPVGGVSSVATHVKFDSTPPTIQCPADISVSATSTNGAVVNFTVTAADNCPGTVTVVSTPASGSVFPIGTTVVTTVATDSCGNSSQCSFNVVVTSGTASCDLSIQSAVMVTWPCTGVLQSSDSATGPWTDVTGATTPYFAPVTGTSKFYRLRD